ncbi:glycosyltransferase family 4 protein [Algoriphagus sediminis]|uniref:Glycosyltransferase family 4 protein n=1 Tax=Algoriphagus sediminis TaxID=3057113 RepID=A0ABT7YCA4_9BACT|nr:glycosyltransferase family 4 protein [Algoriphagus sediminis]MDN3204153.1 glycosyltransferase family 4 protein [Algoriphagus sediminis]
MSEPRHVLFLQSSSELYGSGRIILQVLEIYQKEGLTPIVILTGGGPITSELAALGIKYYIQNLGILRRKYMSPTGLWNRAQMNLKALKFLDELDETYKFELVYSNTLAVVVGAYWASINNLPHIWHIHEILKGPKVLVAFLRRLLDRSTPAPVVVSEAVKDHWKSKLRISKPRVIHNAIPYEEFLKGDFEQIQDLKEDVDNLVISMIGRINPGKGQLFFLDIAEQVLESYPHCKFVMVGDPFHGYEYIEEEIIRRINSGILKGNVINLGFRTDVPAILSQTDIFVLPSVLPDSFPTVILEAMASGKPVVATDSGGSREMVKEGETGFLIPIGDVNTAANSIIELVKDSDKRNLFGNKGRERVLREFGQTKFEEQTIDHLWLHLAKD